AALLTILWGVTLGSALPILTGRAGWDSVAATGRRAIAAAESAPLTRPQREALHAHERELRASLEQAERFNYLVRRGAEVVVASSVVVLAAMGFGASRVAGHLSRQLSRPIDELVEWTELIRRGEALPTVPRRRGRGAPEFEMLRQRLRMAAVALDLGRQRAVEAERLRTFRESARQVAHELKNPLTPIRFAIDRLRRGAPPELADAVDVLATETARLERTARSFAQFGRLPDGPPSEIDVGELVRYAATSAVPPTMSLDLDVDDALPMVMGYHDALAGAVSNVLLNAVDACDGRGTISVRVEQSSLEQRDAVRVTIADDGPGIAPDHLKRIWEPYVTNKAGGTGLGLAIARQAVWAHDGAVAAESVLGSGTRIEFTLPVVGGTDARSG
ncbi:MAG TPA: HAMP domain-containing sensor histidine kinase, partial [Candidatus Elarobacter sp.]|nr:HAMP domain-containing sensor histidine kinase [Candidatus Elarobacter sp.]